MKVLIAGWFSFPNMGATAGDLLARDVACAWLDEAGRAYDVAAAPPFDNGVDWQVVDPSDYSDVIFVCGPFGNGWPIGDFLARFAGRHFIGVDLSMLEPLDAWNPFDVLLERDSSRTTRPDISLVSETTLVPVVGVVLAHPQKEYAYGRHHEVAAVIDRLLERGKYAFIRIDTRLDVNAGGLRTPSQVESLIARVDVVMTTRLHGLVLAIKHGVPAVAIDPIVGGAKVRRQAELLGWPCILACDSLTDEALSGALDWALTHDARCQTTDVRRRAVTDLGRVRESFMSAVAERRPVATGHER